MTVFHLKNGKKERKPLINNSTGKKGVEYSKMVLGWPANFCMRILFYYQFNSACDKALLVSYQHSN